MRLKSLREFLETGLLVDGPESLRASVPGGIATLHGTVYSAMARYYLGDDRPIAERALALVKGLQCEETGLFIGPELQDFIPAGGAKHGREHLLTHQTCATLALFACLKCHPEHGLKAADIFLKKDSLIEWLNKRDLRDAWYEGNNLLFVSELLSYPEKHLTTPEAREALAVWFDWLDSRVDDTTGLWGTDKGCDLPSAIYGGYHQLLAYYYWNKPVRFERQLVDSVLRIQAEDGGFHPNGNAGACEDVDSVDILVNMYKRTNYRRREIRIALKECARHILDTQQADGGFPYQLDRYQSHMGIPGTEAGPNVSTAFATWFRIHTLALINEIDVGVKPLRNIRFRFNPSLSMGWHDCTLKASPPSFVQFGVDSAHFGARKFLRLSRRGRSSIRSILKRIAKRMLRS